MKRSIWPVFVVCSALVVAQSTPPNPAPKTGASSVAPGQTTGQANGQTTGVQTAGQSAGGSTAGPTPPIQPNTPDITMPPVVMLPTQSDNAQPRAITAADAAGIALQNQPSILVAHANAMAAQGRLQQARSALFPQLSLNGGYTFSDQLQNAGGGTGGTAGGGGTGATGGGSGAGGTSPRSFTFSSSISATQLLFDFNRTVDTVRAQEAAERAAGFSLTATQQLLASIVKQDYYTYQQNQGLLTVSRQNLTRAQEQLALAQARVTAGLGEPGDLVQAKTVVASAVISLTTAETTAETSRTQLALEMGIDPRTPFAPTSQDESDAPSAATLANLVDTALRNRPEIEAARESVSSAQFGLSAARKNNLPKFSLSAGLSPRQVQGSSLSDSFSLAVLVSWDFFDSGFSSGLVKESQASVDIARANLIQTSNQVVQEVSQAYLDLQSAQNRVITSQQEVANAQEFLRIAQGRYRGGIGLFTDVTTAEASLTSAQRDVVLAQFDLQRARVEMKKGLGTI